MTLPRVHVQNLSNIYRYFISSINILIKPVNFFIGVSTIFGRILELLFSECKVRGAELTQLLVTQILLGIENYTLFETFLALQRCVSTF